MSMDPLDQRIVQSCVDARSANRKLIDYLTARFSYHSASEWQTQITNGLLLLNNQPTKAEQLLQTNDVITYLISHIPEPEVDCSFEVCYEDEWLLAINKSGNLPCHPAGPFYKHTLWFLLKKRYGKIHLVNRLDRETSGLLLVAKDSATAAKLTAQLTTMQKSYLALVFGCFSEKIDANGFLIKDNKSIIRKKREFVRSVPADISESETAQTWLSPEKSGTKYSLVRAEPKSGRLHQIRATLFSLGFPLLGDKIYGPDDTLYLKIRDNQISPEEYTKLVLPRQALHSAELTFIHPHTQNELKLTAPLPTEFQSIIATI